MLITSMILIVVFGTYYQDGGFHEILAIADRNDRLDFFKYELHLVTAHLC